ncbi:MAG TPA: copper resistance protein CopC [Actinomycetota bacterium]|nr:copper resistance protein CopC [Actinomycetota bacterium]
MVPRQLRWAVLALAALALIALPAVGAPAAGLPAHALPVTTSPTAGQTLQSSPTQVVMTFTERPDPAHSAIEVLDTSGKVLAGPAVEPVPGQPETLRIAITTPLQKGVYTVNWKTISTVDGHLATGAFSFGVGEAPTASAPSAAVKSPGPSELAIVARFLYLAGLIALLGLVFLDLIVLRRELAAGQPGEKILRRVRQGMAVAWLVAFVGTLGMVQSQRSGAGLSLSGTLGSSIGQAFLWRLIPLIVTGAGLLALRIAGKGLRQRPYLVTVALGTLASMLADVLKGHAAGANSWVWFRVVTQWIHFAAAGIWVGGLGGLLLCLAPLGAGNRAGPAKRFSFYAGGAIVVVGITGVLRALDEVGSWKGLFHTSFGQLIIVKIVLFGCLAGLGALNRYRNVKAVEHNHRGLVRTGTAEIVVMAVVLGATGWLQNLAPSKSALASSAAPSVSANLQPIVAQASDPSRTYKIRLTISPGTPGFDTYTLKLTNYLTGSPVNASSVSISFDNQFVTSLGTSDLTLTRKTVGSYTAKGANLGVTGPYLLTVTVGNGLNSVDIPIELVSESPPQKVAVQRFTGTPTTYTLPVDSSGDEVQIYLDPIQFGKAEFHTTFQNTTGQEIQMQQFIAVDAQKAGGAVTGLFNYRPLDPIGHFVSDATVPKGTYQFSVAGVTGSGTAVGATLTVPVT